MNAIGVKPQALEEYNRIRTESKLVTDVKFKHSSSGLKVTPINIRSFNKNGTDLGSDKRLNTSDIAYLTVTQLQPSVEG